MDLVQPSRHTSSIESLPESEVGPSGLSDVVRMSAGNFSDYFQSSCHIGRFQAHGSGSHHFFLSDALMLLLLLRTLVFPTPCLFSNDQSTILLY